MRIICLNKSKFTIKFKLSLLLDYYCRYLTKYLIVITFLSRFKRYKDFIKILLNIFYYNYSNFELI